YPLALQRNYPPFLTRPFFAIRRCVILIDNYAVMQRCTQMKLTSFFSHKCSFLSVVFDRLLWF
ncbi:unnamed protein product, partial [Staurois parvus]